MKITNINLTKSQKKVLLKIKQGNNIFIEGVAGTGKTFFLKTIKDYTNKNVLLFGTTGASAVALDSCTVSSNNGLALGKYDLSDKEIQANNNYKWDVENTIICIDEVSFLSLEQFSQIEVALKARGKRNEFMGGFQVIISGDFKQMPFIGWGSSLEESNVLTKFTKIKLLENIRQKNSQEFFNILNKIRYDGITASTKEFLTKKHNPFIKSGVTIVATRSLMDELNNKVEAPLGVDTFEYSCDERDVDKSYNQIKIWEGMPVLITKNNSNRGYCNGDTGIVVSVDEDDDEVLVELDRNGDNVWVEFCPTTFILQETEVFFNEKTKKEDIRKVDKTYSYSFMPILPATYISIRRCQGLTLTNGILHESILNAKKYNYKDYINIQYVALSRFENCNQFRMEGLSEENSSCCDGFKNENFNFCPICGKIIKKGDTINVA